jgi:hypothetical protein
MDDGAVIERRGASRSGFCHRSSGKSALSVSFVRETTWPLAPKRCSNLWPAAVRENGQAVRETPGWVHLQDRAPDIPVDLPRPRPIPAGDKRRAPPRSYHAVRAAQPRPDPFVPTARRCAGELYRVFGTLTRARVGAVYLRRPGVPVSSAPIIPCGTSRVSSDIRNEPLSDTRNGPPRLTLIDEGTSSDSPQEGPARWRRDPGESGGAAREVPVDYRGKAVSSSGSWCSWVVLIRPVRRFSRSR